MKHPLYSIRHLAVTPAFVTLFTPSEAFSFKAVCHG